MNDVGVNVAAPLAAEPRGSMVRKQDTSLAMIWPAPKDRCRLWAVGTGQQKSEGLDRGHHPRGLPLKPPIAGTDGEAARIFRNAWH